MKILIVTDAWFPQINGVVRTLEQTGKQLEQQGHDVVYLTHQWPGLKTFPLPTYPEIKLVWNIWKIGDIIREIQPDAIHIATEGTLGMAARSFCYFHKLPITSSYHTKTPEYIKERFPWFPLALGYWFMRWLHRDSRAVLVTTESMKKELDSYSLHKNLVVWTRGTDYSVFNPQRRTVETTKEKTLLYVGRVSVEKNIEAFLDIHIPNTHKVVVGDGPQLQELKDKYFGVNFVGAKTGVELAEYFANADVFVFPSKTDTFGIVMIEAAGCGTPIAAYPVTGPIDFVVNGINGYLDEDLQTAIELALRVDRCLCHEYTKNHYSWELCASIFRNTLVPVTWRWKQLKSKN